MLHITSIALLTISLLFSLSLIPAYAATFENSQEWTTDNNKLTISWDGDLTSVNTFEATCENLTDIMGNNVKNFNVQLLDVNGVVIEHIASTTIHLQKYTHTISLDDFEGIEEIKMMCKIHNTVANEPFAFVESVTVTSDSSIIEEDSIDNENKNYADIDFDLPQQTVKMEWDFQFDDIANCRVKTITTNISSNQNITAHFPGLTLDESQEWSDLGRAENVASYSQSIVPCQGSFEYETKILDDESTELFTTFVSFLIEFNDGTLDWINELGISYFPNGGGWGPLRCNDLEHFDVVTDIYIDPYVQSKITDWTRGNCHNDYYDSWRNLVNPPSNDKKNGGSSYNEPPTIGKNHDGRQIIKDGLILNDIPLQVNYFYTEMPMQYTETFQNNTIKLKVYDQGGLHNIEMINIGFGVKEIGSPLSESDAILEIKIDNFGDDVKNPRIDKVTLIDENEIINNYDVTLGLTPCGIINSDCLSAVVTWDYANTPSSTVLMTSIYDNKRAVNNDYFNDGLTVIDPNYIPPQPQKPYQYECKDAPIEEQMVQTRLNCNFGKLIISEQVKAQKVYQELYK